MGRSNIVTDKRKNRKNNKKTKNNKNVISYSDRKKNKFKVEQMNKLIDMKEVDGAILEKVISDHNSSNSRNSQDNSKNMKIKALHTKRLIHDQKKDKIIQENIEKEKKEAENSISKQIEMISGFSL